MAGTEGTFRVALCGCILCVCMGTSCRGSVCFSNLLGKCGLSRGPPSSGQRVALKDALRSDQLCLRVREGP